tara:strand:+ start:184 stop:783 length:600 start_codon:yes stop_codon:yes gene_type:complete
MVHTVREDLNLCVEFKITPRQLMFVKMLIPDLSLQEPFRRKARWAMAFEFQDKLGGLSPEEIADLVSRDMIIDSNTTGQTQHDYYEVNPTYQHKFTVKAEGGMPSELYKVYPPFFKDSQGKEYVARNCSLDDIALNYIKAIRKDGELHKQIISDVKWAVSSNAIPMGLKKFVDTQYWEALHQIRLRSTHKVNNSDVTIL